MPEAKQLSFSLRWLSLGATSARSGAAEPAESPPPAQLVGVGGVSVSELVRSHLDSIWRLLRRLGVSPSRADDLTQEVFLVAMRRRAEIEPGRERGFLYAVAVRVAANARRQQRRQREVPEHEVESVAPDALPDEVVERRRQAAQLDALLDELPDKLRRVLVLSDVMELEVGEVAALEGIPRGTVASRLKRARELFKKKVTCRVTNARSSAQERA